jgi:hypothetical protein
MKFDDAIGDPISITVLLVLNILQLGFDLEAILRGLSIYTNLWSPQLRILGLPLYRLAVHGMNQNINPLAILPQCIKVRPCVIA